MTKDKPHIGMRVREFMDSKGIKYAFVADKLNMSRQNFYDLLERQSIDTRQLLEIGKILEHDFLTIYEDGQPTPTASPAGSAKRQVITLTFEHGELIDLQRGDARPESEISLRLAQLEKQFQKMIDYQIRNNQSE